MPSKKKESPFKGIISQVKSSESPSAAVPAAAPTTTKKVVAKRSPAKAAEKKVLVTPPPAVKQGKNRQPGKSSDPTYTQATLYIRKDTHHEIKRRLLDERNGRDMSELAEELFRQWLATKK